MNQSGSLKYRQHFLSKHIIEYADSLQKVMPVFFEQEMPALYCNKINSCPYNGSDDHFETMSKFSDLHLLKKVILWLKNSSEEDFLWFCLLLVECGQYCLFSDLLKHHAIDCAKLQQISKLLNRPNYQRIKNWTEVLKENKVPFSNCELLMGDIQREYLKTHTETLRTLMTSLDDILDYLLHSKVLAHEQVLMIKCSASDKRVGQTINFLTNEDATSDSYQHLCHALLLTNQFTLFIILHDLCDLKRIELFFQEHNPFTSENDENKCKDIPSQENNTYFAQPEQQEMGEGVPMPSGVLEDLSVDKPDTSSASQLAYYSTPALQQDVYRNFSKPRGLALIINNYKFQQCNPLIRNRDGTEVDKKNVSNLLTQLGYLVLPALVDLTASEMLRAAFDFAADPRHVQADSCVMVVLTHGEYDYFTGVDGNKVNLHRFLSSMNSRNAPKLAGKPKIFIMQACRGEIHDKGIERYVPVDRSDSLLDFRSKLQSQCHSKVVQEDHSSFNFLSCIGLKSPGPSATILSSTSISEPFPPLNASTSVSTPPSSSSCIRQRKPYCEQSPTKQSLQQVPLKAPEPDPKLYKVIKEPSDADMLIAYATTPNYVSWCLFIIKVVNTKVETFLATPIF